MKNGGLPSVEPFGIYSVTPAKIIEDVHASPRRVRGKNWVSSSCDVHLIQRPTSIHMIENNFERSKDLDNDSGAGSLDMLTPASDLSHSGAQLSLGGSVTGSTVNSSFTSPEELIVTPASLVDSAKQIHEQEKTRRTNAEVMRSVQHATSKKLNPYPANHLLSVTRGFPDDISDCESLTGSLASVSMLDDDQVQSLMLETEELAVQVLQGQSESTTSVTYNGSGAYGPTFPNQYAFITGNVSQEKVTPEQALIAETSNRLQELVEKCLLDSEDVKTPTVQKHTPSLPKVTTEQVELKTITFKSQNHADTHDLNTPTAEQPVMDPLNACAFKDFSAKSSTFPSNDAHSKLPDICPK